MKSLQLKTIVEHIHGEILKGNDDIEISTLVTRLKNIKKGAILFDIYHDKYKEQNTLTKDTFAIVTDNPTAYLMHSGDFTLIQVENTDKALWKFIEFYRSLFSIPVIGVTGTCGKTTTKEMIKHILAGKYNVNATYKSYNAEFRHLGYLLEIDDSTEAGVYEMGVAYPNDLITACRYFKPQIGVITNIGVDHLNAFGTVDAYIQAKGRFIEGLGYKGTLILNADDENSKKINLESFKGKVVYYGFDDKSHFKILSFHHTESGVKFKLQYGNESHDIFIPGFGDFTVYNAAAAVATAYYSGFGIHESAERLKTFKNVERHFELKKGLNGSKIIDDTWSTNPTSTEAALKLLKELANGKKTIAVLGKMSLLGRQSSKYHNDIGGKVHDLVIDELIVIGDDAIDIGIGALKKGMRQKNIRFCSNADEVYEILKKELDENTIALFKTSMLEAYPDLVEKVTEKIEK